MASAKPQILFRTTAAQKAALQRLSDETGAPMSWHVRQAIDQYLKQKGVIVMDAYRAAIYRAENGEETRMTGPEHAELTDEELIEAAISEAKDAGLIGDEWPRVSEEDLRAGIYIGEWVE